MRVGSIPHKRRNRTNPIVVRADVEERRSGGRGARYGATPADGPTAWRRCASGRARRVTGQDRSAASRRGGDASVAERAWERRVGQPRTAEEMRQQPHVRGRAGPADGRTTRMKMRHQPRRRGEAGPVGQPAGAAEQLR